MQSGFFANWVYTDKKKEDIPADPRQVALTSACSYDRFAPHNARP